MRNDLDLTRAILESIRDRSDLSPQQVEIAGYDPLLVARHVERLLEDGMIEGPVHRGVEGVARVLVRDMTTTGHQFLNALESGDILLWLKAALSPSELGALSLREVYNIATGLALRSAKKKLGLD